MRIIFTTMPLIILSMSIYMIMIQPASGVGSVSVTTSIVLDDYYGSDKNDPLDISEFEEGVVEINIEGSVLIDSTSPHILQDVNVYLNASPLNFWSGFEEEFFYRFEPEVIHFETIIPKMIQEENFTLTVYVNKFYSPGDNGIEIGGSWNNDPGALGGTIDTFTIPLYIQEVNGAEIYDFDNTGAYIFTNGVSSATGFVKRVGNIREPLLHVVLEGEEDASLKGFDFEVETMFDPLNEPNYGHIWVHVTTTDTRIGDDVDITIILIENGTDMEFDRHIWNVEVKKEREPDPVDDDHSDDNTDKEDPSNDDSIDDDTDNIDPKGVDPTDGSDADKSNSESGSGNDESNNIPSTDIIVIISSILCFSLLIKRKNKGES